MDRVISGFENNLGAIAGGVIVLGLIQVGIEYLSKFGVIMYT